MKTLIKHARVLNPAGQIDRIADVLIEGEFIKQIAPSLQDKDAETIDAGGKWLLPGAVDIQVLIREPGGESIESFESGLSAAAAGGITSIVCMPTTNPTVDNRTEVEFINDRAALSGKARVYPTGCLSNGAAGDDLNPMGEMISAGAVAVTDGEYSVPDAQLMLRALSYSTIFHVPVMTHCEDKTLSNHSQINDGRMSVRLGILGSPAEAEMIQVSRNIILAQKAGAHLHINQVSTAGSVDIIRFYKAKGVNVTAGVTPHHLLLTEDATENFNSLAKVNPPLRTKEDQDALFEGLKDGAIDCIASSHCPCATSDKKYNFMDAPHGISGLETLLPLTLGPILQRSGMSELDILSLITNKPARIVNIPAGELSVGEPADLTLWNPKPLYKIDKTNFLSNAHNTPFHGMEVKGRVEQTFLGGRVVYQFAEE